MQTDPPTLDIQSAALLLGGGPLGHELLADVLKLSPVIFAADGGAHHLAQTSHRIDTIIGDLDSLTNLEVWRESGTKIAHVAEQDSTDFEKCVKRITHNPIVGLGFIGGRLDHELAVLNTLALYPQKAIVLVGPDDVVIHCPPQIELNLPHGTRLSLFPLGPVRGEFSHGLRWSIEGLNFAPMGQIGTSNEVSGGPVRLGVDGAGLLLMAPRAHWREVLRALLASDVHAKTETGQN